MDNNNNNNELRKTDFWVLMGAMALIQVVMTGLIIWTSLKR